MKGFELQMITELQRSQKIKEEKAAVIVTSMKKHINDMIVTVNNTTYLTGFNNLRNAQRSLSKARGIFETLVSLNHLSPEEYIKTEEELSRSEEKLSYLISEKRIEYGMGWRMRMEVNTYGIFRPSMSLLRGKFRSRGTL